MYYVYILKSKRDFQNYIGYTNDLKRRFKEHCEGKSLSTEYRRPFELIYYEAYKSKADAQKRESNLKLRSRAYTQLKLRIINSNS